MNLQFTETLVQPNFALSEFDEAAFRLRPALAEEFGVDRADALLGIVRRRLIGFCDVGTAFWHIQKEAEWWRDVMGTQEPEG